MPRIGRVSGGHKVQLEETAKALWPYDVETRIVWDSEIELGGVDLVHGFGLNPAEVHSCRSSGLPVVISPIYWDIRRGPDGWFRAKSARSVLGSFRLSARFLAAALRSRTRVTEACLAFIPIEREMLAAYEAADLLLPNSEGEAESIRHDLGIATPMSVVPNGVDPGQFKQAGEPFAKRDFVLSVGRIDPHKNQLGLIRALKGSGRTLVIVGSDHPDHPAYAQACRAAGSGWVEFLDEMPHSELRNVFARARVHALPSWFETTGLVSLEAALSGCSVVTTERGHAHEYLGDYALYCDPADARSIRRAVDIAWKQPPVPEFRAHVEAHFTWDHAAQATRTAYLTVLNRGVGPVVAQADGV